MSPSPKKYYAVARGRNTGVFSSWFGAGNAEEQVRGFAGARYKGFPTIEEARAWIKEQESAPPAKKSPGRKQPGSSGAAAALPPTTDADAIIYTDGGCSCNPGPGGYGAVILEGAGRRELSGGFRHTTNNRMELTACIEALKAVAPDTSAVLHSDSQYVVNGISKGWAAKWRSKGWMRNKTDAAENYDLWGLLLELCEARNVRFVWVKGHAGNEENERCDRLATGAAAGSGLAPDVNFEAGRTTVTA